MVTKFATAERKSSTDINNEYSFFQTDELLNNVLNSVSGIAAIINQERQIIFANKTFLDMLGEDSIGTILGKRPGEVISCVHSHEEEGGCGTAEACQYCGAVSTILQCQKTNQSTTKDARITSIVNGDPVSWDLRISASPIIVSGQKFIVVTFQDISNENRRKGLERIFFHDIINIAGGLKGILSFINDVGNPEEQRNLIRLSELTSSQLFDEIMSYKQLTMAENNDLQLTIVKVSSIQELNEAVSKISFHDVAKNKIITVDENSKLMDFFTDRVLLQRVIINMLKNALESTPEGGIVKVGIDIIDKTVIYWIHNDIFINNEIQAQLFQRSFSTKGRSRGLGTYSMKLLGEKYLKGQVSFVSSESDGTTFFLKIPTINI